MVSLVIASGCAGSRPPLVQWATDQHVWPPPPEQPRVRFLGEISGPLTSQSDHGWGTAMQRLLYGPVPPRRLITPQSVAVDRTARRVAIADSNAGGVHLLDLERNDYAFLEVSGDSAQTLGHPVDVAWSDESMLVVDAASRAVVIFHDGRLIEIFGRDVLTRPAGIAFDEARQIMYIADAGAHKLFAFDLRGQLIETFGERGAGLGQFNYPTHVACGPGGEIVVADSLNFRVQRFAPDGTPIRAFGKKGDAGGDFALPKGVAVDTQGNIWVVDAQFENIQAFDRDGRLLMALGREGHEPGEFWLPGGLAIDATNRIWVADTYNRRIQVFEILP